MQYILSEEEYKNLQNTKHEVTKTYNKKLFQFCWDAAQNIPAKRFWDKNNILPWGCIYDRDGRKLGRDEILESARNSWYCDECPSRQFCPQTQRFSK